MAEHGIYATLAEVRTRVRSVDTTDDAALLQHLETASRAIDDYCRRHFYVVNATRNYSPTETGQFICRDDILSISQIRTDKDNDRTWGNTWAAGDYELYPYNEFPKWKILRRSDGDHSFLIGENRLELTSLFGYGDGYSATPYAASGATLTVANTTATTVTASVGTPFSAGQNLLCETEQMHVTAVSGTTLTVVRGVNGTTAAAHAAKAASIYQYPQQIWEVCLLRAAKLYRRSDMPSGVAGPGDFGPSTMRIYVDLDTDEKRLLNRFRKTRVA